MRIQFAAAVTNLLCRIGNALLSRSTGIARIDEHEQNVVQFRRNVVKNIERCGWIQCNACLDSGAANNLQHLFDMTLCLNVKNNALNADVDKLVNEELIHQCHDVNIKRQLCAWTKLPNDIQPDRHTWTKMRFDKVHMKRSDSSLLQGSYLALQITQVGADQRWCYGGLSFFQHLTSPILSNYIIVLSCFYSLFYSAIFVN